MTRDMPRVNRARGLPAKRIFVIFWMLKNSGTTAPKRIKTKIKRMTPLGTFPRIAATLCGGIENISILPIYALSL
jgi:hypothetical protein